MSSSLFIHPLNIDYLSLFPALLSFAKFDGRDESGRSLFEGRSSLSKPDSSSYSQCPYTGSRNNHSKAMNKGAFKYFCRDQKTIDRLIHELASKCIAIDQSAIEKLNIFSYVAFRMPSYWMIKHKFENVDINVPSSVASLSKAGHGLYTLVSHIMLNDHPRDYPLTADEFYRAAEEESVLIGESEVCAGSGHQIKRVIKKVVSAEPKELLNDDASLMIKYCRLVSYLELISLLYATMKNIMLAVISADSFNNKDMFQHLSDKAIQSFSHSVASIEMSFMEQPLSHPIIKSLSMEYWGSCYNSLDTSIVDFTESFKVFHQDLCAGINCTGRWSQYKNQFTSVINIINHEMHVITAGLKYPYIPIEEADVDCFYGKDESKFDFISAPIKI